MGSNYLVILLLLSSNAVHAGFVSWLFGAKTKPDSGSENGNQVSKETVVSLPQPRQAVPFEMKTTDEKFLSQAIMDLSPLDVCHHRVIADIKSTCSAISEEELSKLAVDLLNCQLESEKRKTYHCTNEMTIADCTKDMDATMWNAYQIVSNRARAICYTTRQQQFQMKTEYTVNTLIETTSGQLQAMDQLKVGQEKISESTSDTLKRMSEGQQKLISHQNQLKSSQNNIQTNIVANLRELTKEKALIAAGHRELAHLTEAIKQKLDITTAQIQDQGSEQRKSHDQILTDLAGIQDKAKQVWQKIDDASRQVVNFQDETGEHYQQTLENLQKINNTVNFVLNSVNDMKQRFEQKLSWLTRLVGGTGNQVNILLTCAVHFLYFLMVVLSASFLKTPMFSRIVMLFIIPLNVVSEVKQGKSLDFTSMTLFISITVIANWLLGWICSVRQVKALDYAAVNQQAVGMVSPVCTCAQSSPPDGSNCPLNGTPLSPPTKVQNVQSDSASKYENLKSPDLKKLISVLEKIYYSGGLKEMAKQKSDGSMKQGDKLDQNSNSPVSAPSCLFPDDKSVNENTGEQGPENEASIAAFPTPKPDPSDPSVTAKDLSDPDMVKRQLIHSLEEIVTPSRVKTPGRSSRAGTPTSRSSSRKNSPNRPLCAGTTRSGQQCKLVCVEGKEYCYKHV